MKKRKQPKFKPGDPVWVGIDGIFVRPSKQRQPIGYIVQVLPRGLVRVELFPGVLDLLPRRRVVIEMLNSPPKKSSPSPLDTPEDYVMLPRMVTSAGSKNN